MRVSSNFSKTAAALVLASVPDATRVRLKIANDGSVMFMPTARKVVNNLPKDELKARALTRDARKGTMSMALNVDGINEGIYVIAPTRHNWFAMTPYISSASAPLGLATVRFSKKSG